MSETITCFEHCIHLPVSEQEKGIGARKTYGYFMHQVGSPVFISRFIIRPKKKISA